MLKKNHDCLFLLFLVELVGIFDFPKAILLGTEFGLLCKLQQSSCGF